MDGEELTRACDEDPRNIRRARKAIAGRKKDIEKLLALGDDLKGGVRESCEAQLDALEKLDASLVVLSAVGH